MYIMRHLLYLPLIISLLIAGFSADGQHSVAREWNEANLHAIRNESARPTIHARNLFHISMAMYDAWAVYDEIAETYLLGKTVDGFVVDFEGTPMPDDIEAAKNEAISYAAYRLIRHRYKSASSYITTIRPYIDNLMNTLGYDISFTSQNYQTGNPAALGNYIADQVRLYGLQDGSKESFSYNNLFYQPVNDALIMINPGNPDISDPDRWQPLSLSVNISQSGDTLPAGVLPFLSPEWGQVSPFSLKEEDATIYNRDNFDYVVYHDPGIPPLISDEEGMGIDDPYKWGFSLVSIWASHLDPSDGVMWDISPASIGNNPEPPVAFEDHKDFYNFLDGGDQSQGHAINPSTGEPYEPQMVPRGDFTRALAEFWADGPDSETPPGHWFSILNEAVHDHPDFVRRFGGEGPELEKLEWDVKAYFSLGGAMHDCAIAAWGIKGWYDYLRPVSALRYMADQGQSTDPTLPNFDPHGIPLVEDYIEIVEAGDPLAGANNEHVGKIKLYTWKGHDYIEDTETDVAGVDWILAERWYPYQRPTFVTPPFAGYVSGHSTFSRAAAELLERLTGDAFFPGGMGVFPVEKNEFLEFEEGPSVDFELQWATYKDASDQTSLSRIWGGIHPPADDLPGRKIGEAIGNDVFDFVIPYFYRDEDMDGFTTFTDCDDQDASIYPGADELCDNKDNDCNGAVDDGLPYFIFYADVDEDGYGDPDNFIEICENIAPTGFVAIEGDCDDMDIEINDSLLEICDGKDNDCNGMIDDGIPYYTYYYDGDLDGYGDPEFPIEICLDNAPDSYVSNSDDCDDYDSSIFLNAPEVCDGRDNDCNGISDDGIPFYDYYEDQDGDGFGNPDMSINICLDNPPTGYVVDNSDCDDTNALINPSAAEIPDDGVDDDCTGFDLFLITKYFPNPATNQLTIHYQNEGELTLRIYDPLGRLLKDERIVFENNRLVVDLADYWPGIYFFLIENDDDQILLSEKITIMD